MKTIIALKDMPFCKKGEKFDYPEDKNPHINQHYFLRGDIKQWVSEGWFAWVNEKKNLREKFLDEGWDIKDSEKLAQIAEQHFKDEGEEEVLDFMKCWVKKSEVLKKFDEVRKRYLISDFTIGEMFDYTRKALEQL